MNERGPQPSPTSKKIAFKIDADRPAKIPPIDSFSTCVCVWLNIHNAYGTKDINSQQAHTDARKRSTSRYHARRHLSSVDRSITIRLYCIGPLSHGFIATTANDAILSIRTISIPKQRCILRRISHLGNDGAGGGRAENNVGSGTHTSIE